MAHLAGQHVIQILPSLLFSLAFPLPLAAAAAAAETAVAATAAEFEEPAPVDRIRPVDRFFALAARHTSSLITTLPPCSAIAAPEAAHLHRRFAWWRLAARGAVDMDRAASYHSSISMSATTARGSCIMTGICDHVRKKA
jgi:hypothetical protein